MSEIQASSARSTQKFSHQLPPSPRGYLILNAKEIKQNPIGYYQRIWKEYGDLVRLPILPSYSFYLSAHPSHLERILSTHQERYGKSDIANKPLTLVVGQGILTSEGEFWQKNRRLMQPAFHQKQLANLCAVIVSCTESLMRKWEEKSDGEAIDIAAETLRLTLKIAGLTLFSTDISDKSSSLGKAFRTVFEYINYKMNNLWAEPLWIPTSRNLRFRQAKQILDDLVLDLIRDRRQNPTDTHDLLSMLLAVRDEVTGEGMSDKQLQDEVITLLIAGHESVASALAWTWYLLGKHPDIMANVEEELRSVLNGNSPSFEKLPKLEYTRRVIDETLRLYPPALVLLRVALEDDEIDGYFIPKGSTMNLTTFIIHCHPEFWDNPEKFDPDRFLPEKTNLRPKFAYRPFGAGQRICIGKSFALMQAALIMATMLQRFRLELIPNQPIELDTTFALRPKYGIKVKLWKRT
jgi:cytochrome P450